jgi:hypothetical protein
MAFYDVASNDCQTLRGGGGGGGGRGASTAAAAAAAAAAADPVAQELNFQSVPENFKYDYAAHAAAVAKVGRCRLTLSKSKGPMVSALEARI